MITVEPHRGDSQRCSNCRKADHPTVDVVVAGASAALCPACVDVLHRLTAPASHPPAPDLRPPVGAHRPVILYVRHKLPARRGEDRGWGPPSSAVLVGVPADLDPESPAIRTMLTQVATNLGGSLHGHDWTILPHRGHGRTPTPAEVETTAAWWSTLLGVPVVDDPTAIATPARPLPWRL